MKRQVAVSIALASAGLLLAGQASAQQSRRSTDPWDWIIQHVCADGGDKPVPADPYDGCPAGTHERRLKLGDPLPYTKRDLPGRNGDHPHGYQRRDAYPLVDLRYGGMIAANDADFDYTEPYGEMHPGDGDGFDVFRVANGYVTGGGTRDGGGYSSSFFGPDCKPFGGWVFFPTSFLKTMESAPEGRGIFPIRGSYWEQNGQPWPGKCEPGKGFSLNTLTTWSFEPNREFGGVNGAKTKVIDTIVSTHGLPIPIDPRQPYHLERFYFTDLYGLTRWEAWRQAAAGIKVREDCGKQTTLKYEGLDFLLVACREWSQTDIHDPPEPPAPWPYPETNLLWNWHFDAGTIEPWRRTGAAADTGRAPDWSLLDSHTKLDKRFGFGDVGVQYLQIGCGGLQCGGDEAVFQDLPLSAIPAGARQLDYGLTGLIGNAPKGTLRVTISLIDAGGHALWSSSFDCQLSNSFRNHKAEESVYFASTVCLKTSASLPRPPGAAALRFAITPREPVAYKILDAWVMPHWATN